MIRVIRLAIIIVSALCLSLSLSGQKKNTRPPVTGEQADQFEEVHRGMLGVKPDKASEAQKFTAEVARALPRAGAGKIARKNLVDEHILGRMERDGIPHAGLSTDEEFMRRVYLDATGLVPAPEMVREFAASRDPQKRDKLVDSLIGTEEFANQWAWFWGDLFRLQDSTFHYWNKEWLRVDRPYSEVFYDLVTGVGKSQITIPNLGLLDRAILNNAKSRIPTDRDNYFLENRLDMIDEFSIDVARIFLGINTDCIACHDGAGHLESVNLYLARKTREEFHQQAAFLGRTRAIPTWDDRAKNVSPTNSVVDDLAAGYNTGDDAPFFTLSENRFPRSGKTYEPAFLLTGERPRPEVNPRRELARILPSHIQFNRAAVNLIWGKLMTVGFVEPYDSFDLDRLDPKNPPPKPWAVQPTNSWLLDALAEDFRAHNYSIHHLMKTIMKSSAYQLSPHFDGEWKESYTPYYARRFVRVLTGPEVADAIAQVTGRPYKFNFSGVEATRVHELATPNGVGARGRGGNPGEGPDVAAIMQGFFQSNRSTPAQTVNKATTMQALLMMSSPAIKNRVVAEKGTRLLRLVESQKTNEQLIEELFLSSLARWPMPAEKQVALQAMEKDRKTGAEDLQWALLNSIEFVLNH